jgi:N-glycosidase YbiA
MDYASYFIEGKALFGGFPTQERVNELEENGVRYFVNLTFNHETGITPYTTKYEYLQFSIPDHYIPSDWRQYAMFIIKVGDIIRNLKPGELLYNSCKGGHGRSCTVVSSLLCYLYNMTPTDALAEAARCHNKRPILRSYWRERGPPISHSQRNFVCKFFEPILFFRPYNVGYTAGFSTFTEHSITTKLGTFPTAEAAIQAYKNPTDEEYVKSQCKSTSSLMSKNLGRKTKLRDDWEESIENIVYNVYKAKFDQHPELKNNLMNTGLRPIVYCTHIDRILGNNGDNSGQNILGKTLVKIREQYYREEMTRENYKKCKEENTESSDESE